MSVFLDISNIQNNIDKQKYQYFDEFERLIEVNKEFVNSNSSSSHPFENTARVPYHSNSFEDNANRSNQHNFLNLIENTNLPGKSAKIGNFNIYNRCVFFINNSSGSDHLEEKFKIHSQPNKETNQIKSLCTNQLFGIQGKNTLLDPHLNVVKNTKHSKQYKNQPVLSSHRKSSCCDEKPASNTRRDDNKLFYLHKDTLKPVLSTNIKSGIYKRIFQSESVNRVSRTTENNVYFSSSEKNGKILTAVQFRQTYTKDDCQDNKRKEELQSEESYVDSTYNYDPDVTLSYEPQDKHSNEQSDSDDNYHFLAYEVLNFPKETNMTANRTSNETIYNGKDSERKTIYKVIHPSLFGLESASTVNCDVTSSSSVDKNKSSEISLLSKATNRSRLKKAIKTSTEVNDVQQCNPIVTSTTRYGRISKPPQYIQTTFKLPSTEEIAKESTFERDNDDDFKYTREILPSDVEVPDLKIKRERNLTSTSQCNYCNKIYLGKRMQRHLEANPDHNTALNLKEDKLVSKLSLYKFLAKKVKQSPEEHRADIFLAEISDLVDQLQSRGSRFVRNTSGVHFVNTQSSKVLGIPEGHYSIDVSAIDSTPEAETMTNEPRMIIPPPPPRLDYNLSISLDDTISDAKLNLPDNMVSSEESLLRTVNDLVDQGIGDLRGHDDVINHVQAPVIHYDHASDNAVEAATIKTEQAPPILDLSLDLFQFSSN